MQVVRHRMCCLHRMQHPPEQRSLDGIGVHADFVAVEFRYFEKV